MPTMNSAVLLFNAESVLTCISHLESVYRNLKACNRERERACTVKIYGNCYECFITYSTTEREQCACETQHRATNKDYQRSIRITIRIKLRIYGCGDTVSLISKLQL